MICAFVCASPIEKIKSLLIFLIILMCIVLFSAETPAVDTDPESLSSDSESLAQDEEAVSTDSEPLNQDSEPLTGDSLSAPLEEDAKVAKHSGLSATELEKLGRDDGADEDEEKENQDQTGPPEIIDEDLDESEAKNGPVDLESTTVSLEFENEELSKVLKVLAEHYGLNIIMSDNIKGTVNVSLCEVTLREALNAILEVNGYSFVQKGGIIYIKDLTEGKAVEIIPLNYVTASEANTILEKLLSEKGSIQVDERYNRLIVSDMPLYVEKIREFAKDLDKRIPQVLIDAKIVDVTLSDLEAIGIEWGGDYYSKGTDGNPDTQKFSETTSMRDPGTAQFSTGTLPTIDLADLVMKNLPIGWGYFKDIDVKLDYLMRDSKANLLANPRIIVMNNDEAKIMIGEKVSYKEKTQTTTGTTETTRFVDTGTSLRVIPQITNDGHVILSIHPEVSSIESASSDLIRISSREAHTTVIVRDRETIAIGGLIKQEDSVTNSKIPILGDIPFIGEVLFSNKGTNKTRKELVVFITPYIIRQQAPDNIRSNTRNYLVEE